MATLILGIITFLLVLGPLVVLHEFGHFLMAKATGVKVVEFGFGFPPRAGGKWTGSTPVRVTRETRVDAEVFGDDDPPGPEIGDTAGDFSGETYLASVAKPGDMVAFATSRDQDGGIVANRAAKYDDRMDVIEDGDLIAGKIKEIKDGTIYVSEMLWSFNWLPLGGFVRMVGEEDPTSENSLASKPRWQRLLVLSAGSGVNFILPFVIFTIVAMVPQNIRVGEVVITAIMPGSPALEAGAREGDLIVRVDGRSIQNIGNLQEAVTLKLGAGSNWEVKRGIPDPFPPPGTPRPAFQYTGEIDEFRLEPRWRPPSRSIVREVGDPSKELSLVEGRKADPTVGISNSLTVVAEAIDTLHEISLPDIQRLNPEAAHSIGDVLLVVGVVSAPSRQISFENARNHDPALGLSTSIQEGPVGITIRSQNEAIEKQWTWPWSAVGRGVNEVRDLVILTKNGITGIVIDSGNPQLSGPATVGPIGIGQLTGEISTSDADIIAKITTLANLAATLSLSLAVINILPIPALDGGRIFFVLIEIVRGGRRISPEREGLVHLAGMAVLLGLIAVISVQDVLRIFRGETFF